MISIIIKITNLDVLLTVNISVHCSYVHIIFIIYIMYVLTYIYIIHHRVDSFISPTCVYNFIGFVIIIIIIVRYIINARKLNLELDRAIIKRIIEPLMYTFINYMT